MAAQKKQPINRSKYISFCTCYREVNDFNENAVTDFLSALDRIKYYQKCIVSTKIYLEKLIFAGIRRSSIYFKSCQ